MLVLLIDIYEKEIKKMKTVFNTVARPLPPI